MSLVTYEATCISVGMKAKTAVAVSAHERRANTSLAAPYAPMTASSP